MDDGREMSALMYFAREQKKLPVLSGDFNAG
jgi:hypothetical protein